MSTAWEEDVLISSSPVQDAKTLQRESEKIGKELERILLRLQPLVDSQTRRAQAMLRRAATAR